MPHLCFFCKEPALSLSKGGRRCSRGLGSGGIAAHLSKTAKGEASSVIVVPSPRLRYPHPRLHALVHQHWPALAKEVVPGTAPPPLFGLRDQASFYRVLMDVVQLLLALLRGPQDKIIEPSLPNVLFAIAVARVHSGNLGPQPSQYAPCEALFDGLHHRGRIAAFRLTQQQMDMLRHDDVAHHDEMIASAHALHYFKKQVASGGGLEQRAPLVTTGGDEVQVTLAVAAMKVRHPRVLSRGWAAAL